MADGMDKYKYYAFNSRQKYIIREGIKEGLDVDYYANTSYDYLQMEQIYLCLKEGLDPSILLDPEIDYRSMEKMREELKEVSGKGEEVKEEVNNKRTKRLIITSAFVIVIAVLIGTGFAFKEEIALYFESPALVLTNDEVKLGMSKKFIPLDYVKSFDKDMKLILPKSKKYNIGTYQIKYKLTNSKKTVTKTLVLKVYDDIKPNLILTSNNISIEYGGAFDPTSFISSADDNVDGDLKNDVKYNDLNNTNVGNNTITYTVKDKNGNESIAKLIVNVKEKPIVNNNNSNSNNNNNTNSNKPSSNTSKPNTSTTNPSTYNKFFSGNSIANYNSALQYAQSIVNSGKASGYQLMPTGSGFQVTFS